MRKLLRITVILLISVLIISLFRLYRKYYAYPRIVDDHYFLPDSLLQPHTGRQDRQPARHHLSHTSTGISNLHPTGNKII